MKIRNFVIHNLDISVERCYSNNYERLYINGEFIASKDTAYGSTYFFRLPEGRSLISYKLTTGLRMSNIQLFRDGSRVISREEDPIVEAPLCHNFELI